MQKHSAGQICRLTVPLVAASNVCISQETRKYLVFHCRKRKSNVSNSFDYSFLFHLTRNIIVPSSSHCLLKVPNI
jgi:hypothetical protein